MDTEQVARELVRALRGRRSQVGFSRRLGYATNVAYTWESGRRWPTAAELLRVARVVGVDVDAGLRRFFAVPPAWLGEVDPLSAEGVQKLLSEICGAIPRAELARRTGYSRHAVGRWLSGAATPRAHELLALVHHASGRLPDFVAGLVDPAALPSLAEVWASLEARRTLVGQMPWVTAVLRCLDLASYRASPAHRPGWIALRLGVAPEVEAACLAALEGAGAVSWTGTHYAPSADLLVDTRRVGRALSAHWAEVGLDRLRSGAPGLFGYNVFNVSSADLEEIQRLHRAYFQRLRAVASASAPSEHVVVVNLQLFALSGSDPRS